MRYFMLSFLLTSATFSFGQTLDSVQSKDIAIYFELYGRGEPIYLLSGGPGARSQVLLPIVNELAEDHLCALVHQRGTGRTQFDANEQNCNIDLYTNDIKLIKEKLGHNKITLLGHSWGGMLSMNYMVSHPEDITAVLLLDPGPFDLESGRSPTDNIMSKLSIEDIAHIQMLDTLLLMLSKSHVSEELDSEIEYVQTERSNIRGKGWFYDKRNANKLRLMPGDFNFKVSPFVIADMIKRKWNLKSQLEAVSIPTLIVHGRQDPVGMDNALKITNTIKGSELKIIEQCGHFPWLEQPDELYAVVRSFILKNR